MSDLRALSCACTAALRDADAKGAKIASHFLRIQVREIFRELRFRPKPARQQTDALIRKNRTHG